MPSSNDLPNGTGTAPAPTPSPSISVRNLSYAFPDGSLGLRNVSLSLPARSRTLLIGANGAGKTTLLRLLSLLSFVY